MDIKKYILHVEKLEKDRAILENTINQFDSIISSLGKPKTIWRDKNPIDYDSTHISGVQIIAILVSVIWAILGVYSMTVAHDFYFILTVVFIVPPILVILGIIFVIVSNKVSYNENEAIINNEYEENLNYERERVEYENQIKVFYEEARAEMYQAYENTCFLLGNLYAKNVIFEKYRYDLVAISMFAEYLKSGRCYSLSGHEGAYNLYEHEIRMGIIISKLDEVIERLDRIENNQYRLFETINEIKNQQNRIVSNMNNILKKQEIIIENTEYMKYCMELQRRNSAIAMIHGIRYL